MTNKRFCVSLGQVALTLATFVSLAPTSAKAQKSFSIQTKWSVGGEGGWDYLAVDPAMPRLYVTHGTRVEVLDTGTGKVTSSISGLKGTHGVTFDSDGKFAGIALLKPVLVAGPPNATPATQAALVPADAVRDFLGAHGVNAVGGSSDAKAAVVRVICVRK